MRSTARSITLIIALMIATLWSTPAQAKTDEQVFAPPIFVVNTSFLNVRTGPSAQFSILTTVVGGTELPVLGTAGDGVWYQVSTTVGVGWVNANFVLARGDFSNVPEVEVTSPPAAPVFDQQNPPAVAVPGNGAPQIASQTVFYARARVLPQNVYRLPSETSGAIVTLYDSNQAFVILDSVPNTNGIEFLQIDVPGIGQGWVDGQKVTVFSGPAPVGTVNATAPVESAQDTVSVTTAPFIQSSVVIVNTSFLNVRSGPGAQYTVVFTARGGTQLSVIGLSSDGVWFLVQGTFGQGWVNNEFVIFRGAIESVPIIQGATGVLQTPIAVIGSSVQLYAAPGVNFGLLGSIAGPVEAPIVARTPDFDWIQINTSAGFGWVPVGQVTIRGDANLIPIVNQ